LPGGTAIRAPGPALFEGRFDHHGVDATKPELALERGLAPWAGPIARLDPVPRERLVVEQADRQEPGDGALDELRSIARIR